MTVVTPGYLSRGYRPGDDDTPAREHWPSEQRMSLPDSEGGLAGRVGLVTGASGGIGTALVARLLGADATVIASSRRDTPGLSRLGDQHPGRLHLVRAEMTDLERLPELVARIEAEHGGLDLLLPNAGVADVRTLEEVSLADWQRSLEVNLTAPFLLAQAAAEGMASRGFGRILFISSAAAYVGGFVGPHYAAAKAGLHGLVHFLSSRLWTRRRRRGRGDLQRWHRGSRGHVRGRTPNGSGRHGADRRRRAAVPRCRARQPPSWMRPDYALQPPGLLCGRRRVQRPRRERGTDTDGSLRHEQPGFGRYPRHQRAAEELRQRNVRCSATASLSSSAPEIGCAAPTPARSSRRRRARSTPRTRPPPNPPVGVSVSDTATASDRQPR